MKQYDELLSDFACNFNVRRNLKGASVMDFAPLDSRVVIKEYTDACIELSYSSDVGVLFEKGGSGSTAGSYTR